MAKVIDQTTADKVIKDVLAAVEAVAKKHGLGIVKRRSSYGYDMIVPKFELHVMEKSGVSVEKQIFEKEAKTLGLQKSDFGKEIVAASGHTFRIIGFTPNPYRRSKPVLCARVPDGRKFIFAVDDVVRLLGRTK